MFKLIFVIVIWKSIILKVKYIDDAMAMAYLGCHQLVNIVMMYFVENSFPGIDLDHNQNNDVM